MNLNQILEQKETEILSQANSALVRSRLPHYDKDGIAQNEVRLQKLYSLTRQGIQNKDLTAVVSYAEQLAEERFTAGFGLQEVQAAFNVLEEAVWQQIIAECEPAQLGEALGLISTVHGAGKDALARKYVSLASHKKAPSLNLQALFEGTDG